MPCTTILVGKKASYDGSTMIARNDDSGAGHYTSKKFVVIHPEEQARTYKTEISHLTIELPDNPTNYIYKVTSAYVPPALPSISLVSTTTSNVTIKVNCATNYIGYSAQWEARRQMYPDTRLPVWGPWTDLGQAIIFNETETNRVVEGSFVNGRRNTEIRLKLHISEEATKGVRP